MNIKQLILGLAVAASFASTANASSLVLNGSLENGSSSDAVYVNTYDGGIPNWTVHGAGSSPNWNSVYIYDNLGDLALPAYMPASYYSCGLGFVAGNTCANPDGTGHFINLDGDPAFPAAISQPISGLMAGQNYRLTFNWAAVQRNDQAGGTWDNYLDVSVGDQHFLTPSIGMISPATAQFPSTGFSGWFTTSYDFTWDGVSNVLNFLAHGNPHGLPPSINLDGISLTEVPEPASWQLIIGGLGFGLSVLARRRR